MPPEAWAPCPWCRHWGVRHLVSGRSPPSFLLVLNHPWVHVTTDESKSTQVAQMLSPPASAPGSNAGGLGGCQEETAHTRPVGPPRTTRNDCWMARCPASHVTSPLVLSQGCPVPWGCCERQPGGEPAGLTPGTGGQRAGQRSSPATLKCAWHPGGPSRGLGWTVGGQEGEPGRSHLPLPPPRLT